MNVFYTPVQARKSHDKNMGAVTQFTESHEATLSNICRFAFGKDGRCQIAAQLTGGYRKKSNFESADVLFFDVDDEYKDGAGFIDVNPGDITAADIERESARYEEWQSFYKPRLEKLGSHVIAYPSLHGRLHFILFLSRPIADKNYEQYEAVLKAVFASLKKHDGFECLDNHDLDATHMFYEGFPVSNPDKWAFELQGNSVDVDAALKNAASMKSDNKPRRRRDFDTDIHTEGKRNKSLYDFAIYAICHSKDIDKAKAAYDYEASDSGLDKREIDTTWESARNAEASKLGSDLKEKNKAAAAEDLAAAFQDLKAIARSKFRRAVQKNEKGANKSDRLKSNEIYALYPYEPGGDMGIAEQVTAECYESAMVREIEKYAHDNPVLEMKLESGQNKMLSPRILENDGLELPAAKRAFFQNGIFETYGREGRPGRDFKFIPLQEGHYLVNPYSWDYEFNPELIKKGIEWLNTYHPVQTENTLISFEGAIKLDFLRIAIGRIEDEEAALFETGAGENGKSTENGRDLRAAVGDEPAFKNFPKTLIIDYNNSFDWYDTLDAAIGYFDDIPLDAIIDAGRFKELISKGMTTYDKKFGARWSENKLYKTLISTNNLPTFSSFSSNGLTRKLRVIKAVRNFKKEGSHGAPALTDEYVAGIRALICAALRMPSLDLPKYRPLLDEYPLRRQWIEGGSERGIFSDLLEKADEPVVVNGKKRKPAVPVLKIKLILQNARIALGKKTPKNIADMLQAAGYPVSRHNDNGFYVMGYNLSSESIIKNAASNNLEMTSDVTLCNSDEAADFEKDRKEYADKYEGALKDYCSYLEAMIAGDSEHKAPAPRVVKSNPAAPASADDEASYYGFHTVGNPAPAPAYDEMPPTTADIEKAAPAPAYECEPALSKLDFSPAPQVTATTREEMYQKTDKWLKDNCCHKGDPVDVDGSRWCGREFGRRFKEALSNRSKPHIHDFLNIPMNDYLYDFHGLPPYFTSYIAGCEKSSDAFVIKQGTAAPGSVEDMAARAFFEGYNNAIGAAK